MADDNQAIVQDAEAAGETLARVKDEIAKAIFGQERVIELARGKIDFNSSHSEVVQTP